MVFDKVQPESWQQPLNILDDHQLEGNNDDDAEYLRYRGLSSGKNTIVSHTRWIATTTRDNTDSTDASIATLSDNNSSKSNRRSEQLSIDGPPVCPVRRYLINFDKDIETIH